MSTPEISKVDPMSRPASETAVVSTTAWPGPGSAPTTSVGLPGPSTSTPHRETLAVSPAIVASIDITDIGAAAITPSTSSTRATSSVVRRLAWTVAWASDWKTRRSGELYATAPTKRSSRVVLTVFTKSSKKKEETDGDGEKPELELRPPDLTKPDHMDIDGCDDRHVNAALIETGDER